MLHSIIIPHRGRPEHLELCLWSITHSMRTTGITDYEIVLVNQGEATWAPRLRLVQVPDPGGAFNKSKLLNAGIEAASGRLLTFLDADALVAPTFLSAALAARNRQITRLCYRVRRLAATMAAAWLPMMGPERRAGITHAFGHFDSFPRAYEACCNPGYNPREPIPNQPIFGNSQFTIHRESLGDLRFDESYIGHGFEDLDLIWLIWRRHGDRYRGVLADRQLFHFEHPHEPEWKNPELTAANLARYHKVAHRP